MIRFHPDSERIYRLVGEAQYGPTGEKHPVGFPPNAVPMALRQEVSGIETIAAFHSIEIGCTDPERQPENRSDLKAADEPAETPILSLPNRNTSIFSSTSGWPETPKPRSMIPSKWFLSEQKAHKYFWGFAAGADTGQRSYLRGFGAGQRSGHRERLDPTNRLHVH